MKYLCLVYFDEKALTALSEPELNLLHRESVAFDDELRASGQYRESNALESVQTATTVQMRHGKVSTTDGPFAETKEQLGGFILIEARDLNDAIAVAAKIPAGRLGRVEVRPTRSIEK